jgi:hypothetical protein
VNDALVPALAFNRDITWDSARLGFRYECRGSASRRVPSRKSRTALEAAGVIFIAENGEGPGVRLRKDRPGEE